jgi:transposase
LGGLALPERVSAAAALCYRWDGKRSRLYLQTQVGAYNDQSLIAFLKDLRRHFRGQRVTLLWDGLTSHRSHAMLEYLDTQKHCLQVERLPGYAPELNPVEGLWSSLKGRELANRCESTIGAVVDAANVGVLRIRTEQLAFSFLDHTPLSF